MRDVGASGRSLLLNICRSSMYVFNCLPFEKSTTLIVATKKRFKRFIKLLVPQINNPLKVLSFVESTLVNGAEHLFIKPSVCDKIDEPKKQQILQDMFFKEEWVIDTYYKYSIFDDIRKKLIRDTEKLIKYGKGNKELVDCLEIEKQKLTSSPKIINKTIDELLPKIIIIQRSI